MVSTVVMPRATRAGAASRCSQNETHDRTTMRHDETHDETHDRTTMRLDGT